MRLAAVACVAAACSSKGTVVFGVAGDLVAGQDIDRLEVDVADGSRPYAQDFALGVDKGQTSFPFELPVDGKDGAAVSVTMRAFRAPNELVVERTAATNAIAGATLLYRVDLERECELDPQGVSGIKPCPAGSTCIAGKCADPFIPSSALPPYDPDWMAKVPDACKPGGGTAEVVVGQGQLGYADLAEGGTMQIHRGGQACPGYHVYVGVAMRNLHRHGSTTHITAVSPDVDRALDPVDLPFSYEPNKNGYCVFYGIAFKFADDCGHPVQPFFGKKLKISVTVSDADGASATAAKTATLSSGVAL